MESSPATSFTGERFVVGSCLSCGAVESHAYLLHVHRGQRYIPVIWSLTYPCGPSWKLWTLTLLLCVALCCNLFDSWDPRAHDVYLCDSSPQVLLSLFLILSIFFVLFSSLCLCNSGYQNQGLLHAKQVFWHWVQATAPTPPHSTWMPLFLLA